MLPWRLALAPAALNVPKKNMHASSVTALASATWPCLLARPRSPGPLRDPAPRTTGNGRDVSRRPGRVRGLPGPVDGRELLDLYSIQRTQGPLRSRRPASLLLSKALCVISSRKTLPAPSAILPPASELSNAQQAAA